MTRHLIFVFLVSSFACYLSLELNPSGFDKEVLNDSNIWLVEFYSEMCGSCKEFSPTWDAITSKVKSLSCGKINIDDKFGTALAQKLGVLDQGLPNIQLITGFDKLIPIVTGNHS